MSKLKILKETILAGLFFITVICLPILSIIPYILLCVYDYKKKEKHYFRLDIIYVMFLILILFLKTR